MSRIFTKCGHVREGKAGLLAMKVGKHRTFLPWKRPDHDTRALVHIAILGHSILIHGLHSVSILDCVRGFRIQAWVFFPTNNSKRRGNLVGILGRVRVSGYMREDH